MMMLKEIPILLTLLQPNPQLDCLVEAVYFEGRSEPLIGQMAIANVVLNRVRSSRYPNDVCSVVHQRGQFSYYWDGKHERMNEPEAAIVAKNISSLALEGGTVELGGATHYHATYVDPHWSNSMTFVRQIGIHKFYRED